MPRERAAGKQMTGMGGEVTPTDCIRVLLVDDHALVRKAIVSLLAGCQEIEVVGEAGDGVQAVVKAAELMPDLILMDIQMPTMDGLEATRRIKAAHPSLKIVMLTVVEDARTLSEALKAGAEAYFLKSMAPDDFLVRLRGISRHGASRGTEAQRGPPSDPDQDASPSGSCRRTSLGCPVV